MRLKRPAVDLTKILNRRDRKEKNAEDAKSKCFLSASSAFFSSAFLSDFEIRRLLNQALRQFHEGGFEVYFFFAEQFQFELCVEQG